MRRSSETTVGFDREHVSQGLDPVDQVGLLEDDRLLTARGAHDLVYRLQIIGDSHLVGSDTQSGKIGKQLRVTNEETVPRRPRIACRRDGVMKAALVRLSRVKKVRQLGA